jgi:hypothetical protein
LVILGILVGGVASNAIAQSSSKPSTMEMKAFEEPAYKLALTINDQETLLKRLKQASNQKRLVKIPVVIARSADGLGGWQDAYIGTKADASDPVKIRLNDAALGVSLSDRMHQYCGEAQICKLWLVGYWEDRMVMYDECSRGMKQRQLLLSIRHVAGPQGEGDDAVVMIAK